MMPPQNILVLINLKPFILHLLSDKNKANDGPLYSDTVFSKSFGIHLSYAENSAGNFENFEKYRIAIYSDHLKGIFNVEDWEFDDIRFDDSEKSVTSDEMLYLKMKIMNHLKKVVTLKFLRPKSRRF